MSGCLERHARERFLALDVSMGAIVQAERPGGATCRGACFDDHGSDLGGENELLSLTALGMARGYGGAESRA